MLGHLKPWALPGSKYAPLVPQIPINFTIWTYLDIAFNILVNLPGVRKGPCHEAWRCLIFDPLMLTMAKHWHGMWKRCYEPLQDWSFPLQDVGYKHLLSWSGRFICRCLATCSCLGHTKGECLSYQQPKSVQKDPNVWTNHTDKMLEIVCRPFVHSTLGLSSGSFLVVPARREQPISLYPLDRWLVWIWISCICRCAAHRQSISYN